MGHTAILAIEGLLSDPKNKAKGARGNIYCKIKKAVVSKTDRNRIFSKYFKRMIMYEFSEFLL